MEDEVKAANTLQQIFNAMHWAFDDISIICDILTVGDISTFQS